MDGGLVKIISDFKDNNHELIVRNTGRLNGGINKDGFGLRAHQAGWVYCLDPLNAMISENT